MRGKYGQNISGKHSAAGIVYVRMRYALYWPFKVKRATFFTVNDICMQLLRVCGQRGLHKAGFHCTQEILQFYWLSGRMLEICCSDVVHVCMILQVMSLECAVYAVIT